MQDVVLDDFVALMQNPLEFIYIDREAMHFGDHGGQLHVLVNKRILHKVESG